MRERREERKLVLRQGDSTCCPRDSKGYYLYYKTKYRDPRMTPTTIQGYPMA